MVLSLTEVCNIVTQKLNRRSRKLRIRYSKRELNEIFGGDIHYETVDKLLNMLLQNHGVRSYRSNITDTYYLWYTKNVKNATGGREAIMNFLEQNGHLCRVSKQTLVNAFYNKDATRITETAINKAIEAIIDDCYVVPDENTDHFTILLRSLD